MSTNYYSGYNPEKPTSKVLNPPGGRSNNIFGGYEEKKPVNAATSQNQNGNAKPQMTAQQEAAHNKQQQQTSSNLFGTNYENPVEYSHTSQRSHANKPKDNSQSNIFGDQATTNSPVKQTNNTYDSVLNNTVTATATAYGGTNKTATAQKKRTGYNPITGESYDDEENQHDAHEEQQHNYQKQKPVAPQLQQSTEAPANNLHTSSRVLQPPGGKSTRLW